MVKPVNCHKPRLDVIYQVSLPREKNGSHIGDSVFFRGNVSTVTEFEHLFDYLLNRAVFEFKFTSFYESCVFSKSASVKIQWNLESLAKFISFTHVFDRNRKATVVVVRDG